jgi:hypothetical protein
MIIGAKLIHLNANRSRVIFYMSLTWLLAWRGHGMSSVPWILVPSSASIATVPSSRKSILACWAARGDKSISSINPLSQSHSLSLSLSPFMSHDVRIAMVFIGAHLAEGGGDAMWTIIFCKCNQAYVGFSVDDPRISGLMRFVRWQVGTLRKEDDLW